MKVYTLLSCLLLTIISYGQINKGSILLGGDVGISRTSLEQKASGGIVYSEEYSRLFLNPKMGIFVSKNVALGVGLGLLNTEQKQTDRMDPRNQAFKGSTTIKTRFINPFVNFQKKIADRVLFSFELDEFRKECLLNGLDEIGLTLKEADAIKQYETERAAQHPWVFGAIK